MTQMTQVPPVTLGLILILIPHLGLAMPSGTFPLRPSVAFSFRAARRRLPGRKAPLHVQAARWAARAGLALVERAERVWQALGHPTAR
jgi:hypothetical protein